MTAPHLKKLRENKGILTVLIILFVLIIINSLILLYFLQGTQQETAVHGGESAASKEAITEAETFKENETAQGESGTQGTNDAENTSAAQTDEMKTDASEAAASDGATFEEDSQETVETGDGQTAESDEQTDGAEASTGDESSDSFLPPDDEENNGDSMMVPSLNALDVAEVETGAPVSFSGTGEPGSDVLIQANGNTLEGTLVKDDGTWGFTTSFDEPGEYTIQVSTMDSEETSAPVMLVVVEPEIEVETPAIDVGSIGDIVPGDESSLSGTGQPGSTVAVVVNGEVVDEVTVGDDGKWNYNFTFDTPGEYDITLNSVDADGKALAESNVLSLLVQKALMEALLNRLSTDTVFVDEPVDFSGTGEPGADVALAVNGEQLDVVTVDEDGDWSYVSTISNPGDYEIRVYTLDTEGSVLAESASETLTVKEAVPLTLNDLDVSEITTDETLNLSGTATPGSEVQIIAGDEKFGVAEVKSDGTWLYAIAFSDSGDYEIFAQAVDENDNVTETTEAADVSVLSRKSAENFAFIFPADGGEIIIGKLTIIGTGDPGLELEVLDSDTVLGTTTIQDNGEWYYSFEPDFGEHVFSAQLIDIESAIGPLNLSVVSAGDVNCDLNLGISRGDNYIVGTCNTFGTVIERTDVDLEALISANPQFQDPDLIYPGDIINIP